MNFEYLIAVKILLYLVDTLIFYRYFDILKILFKPTHNMISY